MKTTRDLWYLTAAGFVILAIIMGVGRFVYTPVLPYMEQEGLSSLQAGLLATINYGGYFAGALWARNLNKKMNLIYVVVCVNILTTILMGVIDGLIMWYVLRAVSGISSGAGFVLVSSLILTKLSNQSSFMPAFLYGGVGFGIFLSGTLTVPVYSVWNASDSVWIVSGLICLFIFLMIVPFIRDSQDKAIVSKVYEKQRTGLKKVSSLHIAYFCEGFGYIIYATFIISILQNTASFHWETPYVWGVVGIACIPSCLFWLMIQQKAGQMAALRWAFVMQIIGVMIPLFFEHILWIIISAFFFGWTFMGITMLTMTATRTRFPHNAQQIIGSLTALYGVGQIAGPLAAGILLSEQQYDLAFVMSGVVLIIGWISLIRGRSG
ncbi:YbfB/YjiJ family MFS transporter [Jeotgalibacillus sp. R-1-5s-1]|uniref:YbfB/YjiJ family MFS transporter n=1 Tax=Jeotgalibacillus sp. R-1-5s-1 TaxID=2555897 RepID=UPI00106D5166|nr:YbfB/YjiJ family MFS transporter [Jeotgalibacillus sp. R-1-5s-1]TFD99909.1 YbfB/YjiJ family MFS transporter [Jeotgalibacillus sp. R-1-5s-1]